MSRRPVAGLCLALAVVAAAAVAPANAQTPEAAFVTIEPVITSSREMLFGVAFTDASHGYAVGAYGRMLVTTDGGATWREQPSGVDARVPGSESGGQACLAPDGLPCTNVIFDVTFADPQHGWMVTESSVRATSDGGATWAEQRVPSVDSIPGAGPGPVGTSERPSSWSFRAVGFSDRQNGTVVGLGGTILSTTDGGATWQWQGDRSYGHLRSVSLPDRQHGQAVSPGGQAQQPYVTLATDNAGASWQMVRADLGPNVQTDEFAAVAFTDAQHGFVGGNGGRIFATSDGGHHWATQRKDTTETFQAMAFSTPKRGLAGGFTDFSNERKASLVATVDGGETWVARLMPGAIVWDVAFATPTTAFAVGCAEWYPPPAQLPCQRSLIAKVTFPGGEGSGSGGASGGSGSGGGGGGGSSVPFVLVGAAIVFFVAGAVVLLRGRRGARH